MSKQQAVKIAGEISDVLNKSTTDFVNMIMLGSDLMEQKSNLSILQSSLNMSVAILALGTILAELLPEQED